MEIRQILRDRTVAILVDLDHAEKALKIYRPGGRDTRTTWGLLQNQIESSRAQALELLDALNAIDAVSPESVWGNLSRIDANVRSTGRDVLALIQGGVLRDAVVNGGIYGLADALIREVAAKVGQVWGGLTIPGERDFIATRTDLIRLTFPQVGIWDLPVVLHEYGHHVAPLIRNELGLAPFEQQQKAARSAMEEAHITELFADLFASYTAGPAYACTLILLRSSPDDDNATRDAATHPSYDRRVRFVLRCLEERSNEVDDGRWTAVITELNETWLASLEGARLFDDPEPAHAAGAEPTDRSGKDGGVGGVLSLDDALFEKLFRILRLVPNGRYLGWKCASRLVRSFDPRHAGALEDNATIRDVLNAAWLARLAQPKRSADIGIDAERLCSRLAQAVQPPEPGRGNGGSHGR